MPAHIRALVTFSDTSDPDPKSRVVNTLTFRHNTWGGILPGPDADALANDLAVIMAARGDVIRGRNTVNVKMYDLAHAEPRRPQADITKTVAAGGPLSNPPEIALCLSFFASPNQPRRRGRIYIGPIPVDGQRPSAATMTTVLNLADSFSGLGGANVDWVVMSHMDSIGAGWDPRTGAGTPVVHKVTDAWVDNEYDTQRRRQLKSTSRQTRAVSG